jgi:hypothetical protein
LLEPAQQAIDAAGIRAYESAGQILDRFAQVVAVCRLVGERGQNSRLQQTASAQASTATATAARPASSSSAPSEARSGTLPSHSRLLSFSYMQ